MFEFFAFFDSNVPNAVPQCAVLEEADDADGFGSNYMSLCFKLYLEVVSSHILFEVVKVFQILIQTPVIVAYGLFKHRPRRVQVNCRAPHLVPARLHFPVPAVSTK